MVRIVVDKVTFPDGTQGVCFHKVIFTVKLLQHRQLIHVAAVSCLGIARNYKCIHDA